MSFSSGSGPGVFAPTPGAPRKLPGENGEKACRSGMHYRPLPSCLQLAGRIHCTNRRAPPAPRHPRLGLGSDISGCGEGFGGTLGWPSPGLRARPLGLQETERVMRASPGGSPLPCTARRMPLNSMVALQGGGPEKGASRQTAGTSSSQWKGAWEAGAPGTQGGRSREAKRALGAAQLCKVPAA